MSNAMSRIKHEIIQAIPPAIFFFISFQLIALTSALMLEKYGIEVSTFVSATIAALIVAKVVLITDLLPIVNRFPEKPLIYNVVWKTCIYLLSALLVRYIEHFIHFIQCHYSACPYSRKSHCLPERSTQKKTLIIKK